MGLIFRFFKNHARQPAAFPQQAEANHILALAGNPNVGKSTVFNGLTGMKQHTGNWPGKTVATAQGICKRNGKRYLLVDLPGTYSLDARSAEETVTKEYLCSGSADAVIVVCDATCLERNLILVLQILEITPQILVCLNLMDEAKRKRIRIDIDALKTALGVPVVAVTAQNSKCLPRIIDTAEELLTVSFQKEPHAQITNPSDFDNVASARIDTAHRIASAVVRTETADPDRFDRKLDHILTGRRYGYPLMLLLLAGILFLTIYGANIPSEFLSRTLFSFGNTLGGFLIRLGTPLWLHDALILGIYRTLAWVIAVMLPPMAIFFPLFTLLEDIGYLPRIAYNLDRPFQCCRACGKQALTMCMVDKGMPRFHGKQKTAMRPNILV